jgi:hypothetical protein
MTLAPHRQDTVAVSSEVFGDRERWGVSLLDLSVGGTTRTTLSVGIASHMAVSGRP